MNTTTYFNRLLEDSKSKISLIPEADFAFKQNDDKWSKKEIVGHLIDSARYNLQRFTEIYFSEEPYQLTSYNQVKLVKINNYQQVSSNRLIALWFELNSQIAEVISRLPEEVWNYPVLLVNGELKDLRFIVNDYIRHLEHHLHQILDS